MKIHWHKRAAAGMQKVEQYILHSFGEKVRQDFSDEIYSSVLALADMPYMGKIDPLFEHRKLTYRSIIVRKFNKIVYYIKDDTIHIAAFWDCRSEPKAQANQVKDE